MSLPLRRLTFAMIGLVFVIIALMLLLATVQPVKAGELFYNLDAKAKMTAGTARQIDGIFVTGTDPAVTVDATLSSGWLYVGAQLGNESQWLTGNTADAQYRAGVAHAFDLGFGKMDFDVGGKYYEFFGNKCHDLNFWEVYGNAGGEVAGFTLHGGVAYADNLLNGLGKRLRYEGGASVPLLFAKNDVAAISAFANVAYNDLSDAKFSYTDWQAGIEAERNHYFVRAYYAANDLPTIPGPWKDLEKERVVIELGAKLD